MAAENDFPLETIIIIVVVIVVLFIAIFFGSRFISTRLRKRNVFKKPSVGRGERSSGGKRKYNGGDEDEDNKAAICEFIDKSPTMLVDKSDNDPSGKFKYLAGVDTIHNMFRANEVNVPDGPMKFYYYPNNNGAPGQKDDKKGFKSIINGLDKDIAAKIIKFIDPVKNILQVVQNASLGITNSVDVNPYKLQVQMIKKSELEQLLTVQLNKVYNNAIRPEDLEVFNKFISDNRIYDIPTKLDTYKKTEQLVDAIIEYLFDNTDPAKEDDYKADYLNLVIPVYKLLYVCDYFADKNSVKDIEFYSRVDDGMFDAGASIINQIYESDKTKKNKLGLYTMLYKFGNRNQLISTILEPFNIKLDTLSQDKQKWIIEYLASELDKLKNIKYIKEKFEKLESNQEVKDIIGAAVSKQPGGGAAKVPPPGSGGGAAKDPLPGGGSKVSTNTGDDAVVGTVGTIIDKHVRYQYFLNIINTNLFAISNVKTSDTEKTIELRKKMLLGKILMPLKTSKLNIDIKSIQTSFEQQYLNTDAITSVKTAKNEGFFGTKPNIDNITNTLIELLQKNIEDFETKLDDINKALYNSDLNFIETIRINTTTNVDTLDEKTLLENIKKISRKLKEKKFSVYTLYVSDENKLKFIANSLIFDGILGNNDTIKPDYKNRMYTNIPKNNIPKNNIENLKDVFRLYNNRLTSYEKSINTLAELIAIITNYNDNLFKLRGLNMYITEYITEYINKSDFTNIKDIYNSIYIINKQIQREKVVIIVNYGNLLTPAKGTPLKQQLVESIYTEFGKQYSTENNAYSKLIAEFDKFKEIKQIKTMFVSAETTVNAIVNANKLDNSVQGNIKKYNTLVASDNTLDFSWFTEQFDKKVAELEAAANAAAATAAAAAALALETAKAAAAAVALEAELKQIIQDANEILTNATKNYKAGDAIVGDIEKLDDTKSLNDQLTEFNKYVDNQLGFIVDINAKKIEFDSKTSGTLQTGEFMDKYTSVHDQTNKFIVLLGRVHEVTKHYHEKYSKIMKDLSLELNKLNLSGLTKKSLDIDIPYIKAKKLSDASAGVSNKLELNKRNSTSKEYKLHEEIQNIKADINTHKTTIDDLDTDIRKKVQDEVTQAVADVTARIVTTQAEITRITDVKDTIKSDINEKIIKDGITPVDALKQTDETIAEIDGLQVAITALTIIPVAEFKDLISNAESVDPVVDKTGLEYKINEYNALIPIVANFATECTSKILTDAAAKAKQLIKLCSATILTGLPDLETKPAENIKSIEILFDIRQSIMMYIDIAGKIDNRHAKYITDTNSLATLDISIGKLWVPAKSYVTDKAKAISDSVTQAESKYGSVDGTSTPNAVNTVISEIESIMTANTQIYSLLKSIFTDPDMVAFLGIKDVSKIKADVDANMQKVNEALVKSRKLEDEVKLKSATSAAAAAFAAAAAAAAASITAAVDTAKLTKAAEDVKETITRIKTDYDTEYNMTANMVKTDALTGVKTITANLPKFKTYIDDTDANLATIKANILNVTGINDAEITSLNAKVTTLEHELAVIKPLYAELNLWNTQDTTTGNEPFKVDIDDAIANNDQTSFDNAIQTADAICNAIIDGIDKGTISTSVDITAKNAELDNIMKDTIPNTIIAAKTAVIDALKTTVSDTIKNDVIDPNTAKVTTINDEIAKNNLDAVITDALAASKKLVDVITDDKAAIETIIKDDINKLPDLNAIANDQLAIVNNIDKGDIITDQTTRRYTQEKNNAIEAYSAIKGLPGVSGIVDKIPQHVKTITDNLATITTANDDIDTADTVSRDPAESLTDRINGMVTIYTEYNKVNPLKSICDTANDEIKKLINELEVLVEVIKLSDKIVKDNIDVFNINETAKTKVTTAHDILLDNQIIDRDAGINFADMQTKVNRITAKVSSIQDPGIVQAVNSVNNELARLQQKNTQINDKLIELNTEYTNNMLNKQEQIADYLNTNFKDNTNNFGQTLAFWINEINKNTGADINIENLSSGYVKQCRKIDKKIKYDVINRTSTDIGNLVREFNRAKTKVNAALKQAITVYQLIMDDDDDDGPSVTQLDDDKVKPFSQNSYDILPLDPKVATLSSNMQFSESKSTATNNPGNSFMYTIVPYDSQELSSDDRVLEIVSFARTQRMPIKDATNIIAKADELLKKYRGTKKVIPGAWIYRGGKLFSSVKPTKIEELERYIELMRRSLMR